VHAERRTRKTQKAARSSRIARPSASRAYLDINFVRPRARLSAQSRTAIWSYFDFLFKCQRTGTSFSASAKSGPCRGAFWEHPRRGVL
jgi:hypothetical protein